MLTRFIAIIQGFSRQIPSIAFTSLPASLLVYVEVLTPQAPLSISLFHCFRYAISFPTEKAVTPLAPLSRHISTRHTLRALYSWLTERHYATAIGLRHILRDAYTPSHLPFIIVDTLLPPQREPHYYVAIQVHGVATYIRYALHFIVLFPRCLLRYRYFGYISDIAAT